MLVIPFFASIQTSFDFLYIPVELVRVLGEAVTSNSPVNGPVYLEPCAATQKNKEKGHEISARSGQTLNMMVNRNH